MMSIAIHNIDEVDGALILVSSQNGAFQRFVRTDAEGATYAHLMAFLDEFYTREDDDV